MTPQHPLESAYARAVYRVDAPAGPFTIRVGQPSPGAEALLTAHGRACWAYLTACNPGSERLPPEVNAERTARLRERLRGFHVLEGEGGSPEGDWPPEHSFLVLGLDEAQASEIARDFGQAAYVAGTLGAAARLVWTV